jgi:hypothetical protein
VGSNPIPLKTVSIAKKEEKKKTNVDTASKPWKHFLRGYKTHESLFSPFAFLFTSHHIAFSSLPSLDSIFLKRNWL